MIKKGDVVEILPKWQDKGDDKFVWTAVDDEEKGRVSISPKIWADKLNPVHVVQVEWIKKVS